MENFTVKTIESEKIILSVNCYHPDHKTREAHVLIHSKPRLDTIQSWQVIQEALENTEDELGFPRSSYLFLRVFCSDMMNQVKVLQEHFPPFFDPSLRSNISLVQQPPMAGSKLAIWAYLVKGKSPVERTIQGNILRSNDLTHLWTANISGDTAGSTYQQTEQMFLHYNDLLGRFNSTILHNAIRTWVFVRDVDQQYADVVNARKQIFEKLGLSENTHYLASTGIEGKNENPRQFTFLDAYAVAGIHPEQISWLRVPDMMCSTHQYGVTFERGLILHFGDRKHIYISGTASINNQGKVLFPRDLVRQTYRTVENVEALLDTAGCLLKDLAFVLVYIRDTTDAPMIHKIIPELLPGIPFLVLSAPICRPEWLVEIEGIAIVPAQNDWPDF